VACSRQPLELSGAAAVVAAKALIPADEGKDREAGLPGFRGASTSCAQARRAASGGQAGEDGDRPARDDGLEALQVAIDAVGAARQDVQLQPPGDGLERLGLPDPGARELV
jgi:hypothetical protein